MVINVRKRIISVILALVMVLGCAAPAFAAEKKSGKYDYNGYPFVLVRGMDFNGLYYKRGTDEEQNCFKGVDAGSVIKVLFRTIGSGIIHWSWDSAVDELNAYLNDIMGLMACDEKGNSKYDVSVKDYPTSLADYPEAWDMGDGDEMGILKAAVEKYGPENVFYYNYDWRLDPFLHADRLNKLINQAIKETGKKKVNLVCCSMGGIETVSYMYKYGSSKLNRVVFQSSTFCGTHVTTDVLRGMISINPYNLYMFASQKLGAGNRPLQILFEILYRTKVFDALSGLANKLIPKIKDRVYEGFLTGTFGTIPAVWALVLPEGYEAAIDYMFGGKEDEYADFIALTEKYQKMAKARDKMLKKAEANGTSICVCAGYNTACVPVYEGGGCNGDSVLEADRMFGGANVAVLGQTLGDDYKAKDPARLSPDRVVDLSGVIFPESTWALNGAPHVGASYGTESSDFLFWLVEYKGKVTVRSNERYPQFMNSSTFGETLRPWE